MEWGNALVGLMMALIVLALMADWPFGLVLLHRWAWPRYAICTCMAGGFALMGLAWIRRLDALRRPRLAPPHGAAQRREGGCEKPQGS